MYIFVSKRYETHRLLTNRFFPTANAKPTKDDMASFTLLINRIEKQIKEVLVVKIASFNKWLRIEFS